MPKIIALSGVSGVGKTYRRTNDPSLRDMPCVDIADIYADHPGIKPKQAFAFVLNKMEELIEGGVEAIVVEAYFRSGSYQREWIEYLAEKLEAQVEYIEITAPAEVCIERIQKQYQDFLAEPGHGEGEIEWMERYTSARLQILQSYG